MAAEPKATTDFGDLVALAQKIMGNPYPVYTGHHVCIDDVWPAAAFRLTVLPDPAGANPDVDASCVVRSLRVPKDRGTRIWASVHKARGQFTFGSDVVDCGAYVDAWTPATNFANICGALATFVATTKMHEQIPQSGGTHTIYVHHREAGHNWHCESFTVNLDHQTLYNAIQFILADIYAR